MYMCLDKRYVYLYVCVCVNEFETSLEHMRPYLRNTRKNLNESSYFLCSPGSATFWLEVDTFFYMLFS